MFFPVNFNLADNVATLSSIERSILKALAMDDLVTIEKLAQATGLEPDQIRRGIEWLKFKGLISVVENSTFVYSLTQDGLAAAEHGLPERRLLNAVSAGRLTIADVLASGVLQEQEINAAIANAKRNRWIEFTKNVSGSIIKPSISSTQSPEEKLLQKLAQGNLEHSMLSEQEKTALDLLRKRPGYIVGKEIKTTKVSLSESGKRLGLSLDSQPQDHEEEERRLSPELITSGRWRQTKLSHIDVQAPVPSLFLGRTHPLTDIINEVKEIFIGLGFSEIDGPIIQSSFWNFDALFTPQDHPAREMQDTFYLSGQKMQIDATQDLILNISKVHEDNWGYTWNKDEAKLAVLRTHTTPITLKYLADSKPDSARIFSIGRVFRNEKVSFKHLVEFHQVEGVVAAPNVTLRDLMGLQKEFYSRMGIKKVKFWPTFFPYTEPSLQSMIYNERLGKWVELFGMGIFRPEVTRPLQIKNRVLAWGGGLERIAMLRFGLDDVRDLYSNKLSWLRSVPKCQL